LRAVPTAKIVPVCLDEYPIYVKIFRGNEEQKEIFSTDQKSLFRKNGKRRAESIEKIVEAVMIDSAAMATK
jgi:hypothetical protein